MKRILISLIIAGFFTGVAPDVNALSLEQAKAKGSVGEQSDGYLGVREDSPEASLMAAQINARRREEYRKIAEKNGTSVASVEALAGQKAIAETPPGQYVSKNGEWVKK